MPAVPTTQGMPSCRAMIAVWLVAPPRSVTSAVMSSGSRPEVSLGARSSATSTDGREGVGHAGLGLAHEVGDQATLDVLEVGDPLGDQAAHAGEDGDELLDGRVHRGHQALAGGDVLGHRTAQPLVPGEARTGGEDLRGRAGGLVGLAGEAVGDGDDRVVVRRHRGVRVGEVAVAEAGDRVGRDLAAHEQGRAGGDSRHDGRPAEHGVEQVWSWTHRSSERP